MAKDVQPKAREVVLQELPPAGKYRIRLVRDEDLNGPAMLDVREYISGRDFEGFTRRGIRLDLGAMKSLKAALDNAISQLEPRS